MSIEIVRQRPLYHGQDVLHERSPTDHPLVIGASPMAVRTIEACAGKESLQPEKQRLVTCMHPQRDVRLLAVAAKVSLADQYANEDTALKIGDLRLLG